MKKANLISLLLIGLFPVTVIILSCIPSLNDQSINLPAISSSLASLVAITVSVYSSFETNKNVDKTLSASRLSNDQHLLVLTNVSPTLTSFSIGLQDGVCIGKATTNSQVFATNSEMKYCSSSSLLSQVVSLHLSIESPNSSFINRRLYKVVPQAFPFPRPRFWQVI